MVKGIINLLLALLMLSSFSLASSDDANLQKDFGPYLNKVPFFLRFSFEKNYKKPWDKSFYTERKAFLESYKNDLAIQKLHEASEAKELANKEYERLREKKDRLRKQRDRLKAEEAKEREEQKENDQRQKDFNSQIRSEKKALYEMQRTTTQGH